MICPCCGGSLENVHALIDWVIAGPVARRLAHVLADHRGYYLVGTQLIDLVYGERKDGGPKTADQVIDVTFCEIRDSLAPYGVVLEGRMGPPGGRRMA